MIEPGEIGDGQSDFGHGQLLAGKHFLRRRRRGRRTPGELEHCLYREDGKGYSPLVCRWCLMSWKRRRWLGSLVLPMPRFSLILFLVGASRSKMSDEASSISSPRMSLAVEDLFPSEV